MNPKLHFNYPWHTLDDRQFRHAVREFLDNGADRFVIPDPFVEQMLQDPEKIRYLHNICREFHVEFSTVHAPSDKHYDLNLPLMDVRPKMINDHVRSLEIAAEFGVKTYAVHVGSYHYNIRHLPLETLRPLVLDAIEKLIPAAEKTGIILAVENSFEKQNSARELCRIADHFKGCRAVGFCYDTGHAHCMESAPGKELSKYAHDFDLCWWDGGIVQENGALELMQDRVVTCHIHDNDGYADLHGMPFDGNINWHELMPKLFACPNMIDFQTEVNFSEGTNWAGKLLAPAGGYSIRRLTDTFRYLGF